LTIPPPKQKPDRAELAGAVRARLEPGRRGEEILLHLARVDLLEQRQPLLVVPGIAADRCQPVRGEGDEIGEGEPVRHVLDVRIEAAVLVDDEDGREPVVVGRPRQIAADASVPLRRRDDDSLRPDPPVVGLNLDRPGVVGFEHLKKRRGRGACGRECLRPFQEGAAAHATIDIEVEEIEKLLRKVRRFLPFHAVASSDAWAWGIVLGGQWRRNVARAGNLKDSVRRARP
jgi:hypothetical protein